MPQKYPKTLKNAQNSKLQLNRVFRLEIHTQSKQSILFNCEAKMFLIQCRILFRFMVLSQWKATFVKATQLMPFLRKPLNRLKGS